MNKSCFDPIEDVIQSFSSGEIVVMVDDEGRENEGDLICAAELVTPDIINFMITHARGLVCVPMTEDRLRKLGLSRMTPAYSSDKYHTAFMDSVDVRENTTTGISAFDRAETIKALISEKSSAQDFIKPGHVFPLKSVNNGVVERPGHTEGTVDLAKICKLKPAGVICEILNEDGTMARRDELIQIAKKFNLKIITIKDLIKYRLENESLVEEVTDVNMPTSFGMFNLKVFNQIDNNNTHLALYKGNWNKNDEVLVRVHSSCVTGDIFSSLRCDCGDQLKESMKLIEKNKKGIVLYMNQEGRGIGLVNKLKAYHLQEQGFDTVEANEKLGFKADARDYGIGAQILRKMNIRLINLITNNPKKRAGLEGYGLKIVKNTPMEIKSNCHNDFYLKTKRDKLGHKLFKLNG